MQAKSVLLAAALAAAATVSISSFAGAEAGHPNIIAAREDAEHAIKKMQQAQKANEYDMGGHAKKAEELLAQAIDEMKLAAKADNKNDKK
jgi:hypothetical protein